MKQVSHFLSVAKLGAALTANRKVSVECLTPSLADPLSKSFPSALVSRICIESDDRTIFMQANRPERPTFTCCFPARRSLPRVLHLCCQGPPLSPRLEFLDTLLFGPAS